MIKFKSITTEEITSVVIKIPSYLKEVELDHQGSHFKYTVDGHIAPNIISVFVNSIPNKDKKIFRIVIGNGKPFHNKEALHAFMSFFYKLLKQLFYNKGYYLKHKTMKVEFDNLLRLYSSEDFDSKTLAFQLAKSLGFTKKQFVSICESYIDKYPEYKFFPL